MGPVAVKYCTQTQQPIGEMLGNIQSSLAAKLLAEYYAGDEANIPTIAYLAPNPVAADPTLLARNHISHSVEATATGEKHVYAINGVLPATGDWLSTLAGPKLGWLQAFLSNVSITHGKQTLPNPVQRVLAPRHGKFSSSPRTVRYSRSNYPSFQANELSSAWLRMEIRKSWKCSVGYKSL